MKRLVTLRVNGVERQSAIEENAILLDVLRESFGLTGTKRGCDLGTCGCCTVVVDGKAQLSCLTLACTVAGSAIETVEGVGSSEALHPIQRAYHELGASQCGFCTPGFIMATKAFLAANPEPTNEEIREALAGNLCRCTGYVKIFEAVQVAAAQMRGQPAADKPAEQAPSAIVGTPSGGVAARAPVPHSAGGSP
jgi:aerobic-type carbon monoxide dehydrogenase small subunit (CoxS/CutS family)